MRTVLVYIALVLVLLLGWFLRVYAAQTFTIPQGTTTYGPFAVQTTDKSGEFSFDRTLWTDQNITLTAVLYVSTDKGATWVKHCGWSGVGGNVVKYPTAHLTCSFRLPGVTHIQVITNASAPITISQIPHVGGKP